MSYNKKDIFLATMLMLFIISLAIVFTVFFKQLYYLDINYLGIDLTSGMSVETIKKNYDVLIAYQSIFYRGTLNLPDFITFHQIVFRNNYWVFDYRSDPVINILPETFFMHCFIMIVIIVITLAGLCLFYYYHKQKQIINDTIE